MRDFQWPLLLPAGFIVLVWAATVVGAWRRKSVSKALKDGDADMAKKYGPEWRQVVGWVKTIDDQSPQQQAAAREQWIREHKDSFGSYYRGHVEFLLRRLDEARGARR